MPRFRSYRGSRSRSIQPVIQSYKKVILHINASFTAGFAQEQLAVGTDSVAAGQTSATDTAVPTGSIIKFIEVQFAVSNVVSTPCYMDVTLQYFLGGQTVIDPHIVGGSNQRNQVLHMDMYQVGGDQNANRRYRFKIPKKFQRIREGMTWTIGWRNTATVNRQVQAIYKFYR